MLATTCALAPRGRSSVGVRLWDSRIPVPNTACVPGHPRACPLRAIVSHPTPPRFREQPMVTGAPTDLCRMALAGGALLVLACGHTEPFSTQPYGTTAPFDPTPPVRLTFNTGPDRGASWLPDGSGILYSAQQPGRPDFDVCLAELPPDGGAQRRLVCDLSSADAGLINAFESPAAGTDGRLAFVKASALLGNPNPSREGLVVAPALDASNATEVQRIPYTLPGES